MIFGKPGFQLIGTPDDPYPPNEPAFILLARDPLAETMLRIYAVLCETQLHNPRLAGEVRAHADLMHVWPTRKLPD